MHKATIENWQRIRLRWFHRILHIIIFGGLLGSILSAADVPAPNQLAVGIALDSLRLTSSGSLLTMINTVGAESAAQRQQSLNQLSGDLFGTTQTLGLQVGEQFQRSVQSRLTNNGKFLAGTPVASTSVVDVRGQLPRDSMGSWIQGFGSAGSLRSDGNASGAEFRQGGMMFGVDMGLDETGVVGVTGGSSFLGFHQNFDDRGQLTSHQVGLYALKQNDLVYVLGSTNYGHNSYDTTRQVTIGGNQSLQGNFVGHQFGTNVEAGLKLQAGFVHFQPLVSLNYLYLSQQSFNESGGPAALSVSGAQADALRSNVGGRLVVDRLTGPWGTVWTPYWQGRWVHELLSNDRIVNASFNGAPIGGAFTTHGNHLGQDFGIFGKGLNVQFNDQWSLFANYDLMFGARNHTHTGSGGILFAW